MTGFADCLRQEVEYNNSPIRITNFYPYYINTGLFAGFSPPLRFLIPVLKIEYATKRIYDAIMAEEKEVYIYSFIFWAKTVVMALPLSVKNYLCQ